MLARTSRPNDKAMTYTARASEAAVALYTLSYLFIQYNIQFVTWLMTSVLTTLNPPKTLSKAELASDHEKNKQDALAEFSKVKHGQQLAMGGNTASHLFRRRTQSSTKLHVLSRFNSILDIDNVARIAHVGGMVTFYELVAASLQQGLLPQVVPELRSIKVGPAVGGLALESSSFKYGLVHESVTEMEVLTGEGKIRTCNRYNENSDLFHGLPNSYGSLGYAISAKVKLIPAAPYVKLIHVKFNDLDAYFNALTTACNQRDRYDFVDGVIFSPTSMVLTTASFVQSAPFTSNYRQGGVYYKSMQETDIDYLTTSDYIWRWDADSFWATKGTPFQNPHFRQLFGEVVLRSDRLRMLGTMVGQLQKNFLRLQRAVTGEQVRVRSESIIQDIGIPVDQCASFVSWLDDKIGIYPLFVCPAQSPNPAEKYPLWPLDSSKLACDIGIFGARRRPANTANGYFNRQIESEVAEHGGLKSLYSQSFFSPGEFNKLYGGDEYDQLKKKYDPDGRFPTMYEKTVLGK